MMIVALLIVVVPVVTEAQDYEERQMELVYGNLLFQDQKIPVAVDSVTAKGIRRDDHPTVLTHIDLEFALTGDCSATEAIDTVLSFAEQQVCPVWIMLKSAAEIRASYRPTEE